MWENSKLWVTLKYRTGLQEYIYISVCHYTTITRSNCIFQEEFYLKKILGTEQALAPVLQ